MYKYIFLSITMVWFGSISPNVYWKYKSSLYVEPSNIGKSFMGVQEKWEQTKDGGLIYHTSSHEG